MKYFFYLLASSSGGLLGMRGLVREISNITYDLASTYCCPSTLTGAWPSISDPVSDLMVWEALMSNIYPSHSQTKKEALDEI
jgi:hypothetical protein